MAAASLSGVFTPVVTPFQPDLSVDHDRLVAQCRWLISQDCGLAVFGTNSEGNSLSVEEKIDAIDALVDAGLPPERMMPGTGACALPDAIRLSAHVARRGCGGALVLPPFYYKGVSDDGIFAFFDSLIQGVGDSNLRVYLYHIPPVAQVGFSLDLIGRLIDRYPETVLGMKDSSGDFGHAQNLLKAFPGWGLFPGNETHLLDCLRLGAVGCISATCNVNPGLIVKLYDSWHSDEAPALQERCNLIRSVFAKYPMIPAMKAAIADAKSDPVWAHVRPPLMMLPDAQRATLRQEMEAVGFNIDIV